MSSCWVEKRNLFLFHVFLGKININRLSSCLEQMKMYHNIQGYILTWLYVPLGHKQKCVFVFFLVKKFQYLSMIQNLSFLQKFYVFQKYLTKHQLYQRSHHLFLMTCSNSSIAESKNLKFTSFLLKSRAVDRLLIDIVSHSSLMKTNLSTKLMYLQICKTLPAYTFRKIEHTLQFIHHISQGKEHFSERK